jgi:hypothetical protein
MRRQMFGVEGVAGGVRARSNKVTTQIGADETRSSSGMGAGETVEERPEVAVDRDRSTGLVRVSAFNEVDGKVDEVGRERPFDQAQKPPAPLRCGAQVRSHQRGNTLGSMLRDGQKLRERCIDGLLRAQPAFPPLIVVGGIEPLRPGEQTTCLSRHRGLAPGERFDGLPVRQGGVELAEDADDHVMQVRADPVGAQKLGHRGAETFGIRAGEVLEDLPGLGATEQVLTGFN